MRMKRMMAQAALVLGGVLALAVSAQAKTLYVSTSGESIFPYSDWKTAATDIQAAVDAAKDGDAVVLAPGIYTLKKGIVLDKSVTVTSFGPRPAVVNGGRRCRCFYLDGSRGARPVLRGVVVTEGFADRGGGVYGIGAALVTKSWLIGNRADFGGGIYIEDGAAAEQCVAYRNTSARDGGGIYGGNGSVVDNCLVLRNAAKGVGGGIWSEGETFRSCVAGNRSSTLAEADIAVAKGAALDYCVDSRNFNALVNRGLIQAGNNGEMEWNLAPLARIFPSAISGQYMMGESGAGQPSNETPESSGDTGGQGPSPSQDPASEENHGLFEEGGIFQGVYDFFDSLGLSSPSTEDDPLSFQDEQAFWSFNDMPFLGPWAWEAGLVAAAAFAVAGPGGPVIVDQVIATDIVWQDGILWLVEIYATGGTVWTRIAL